MRLSATDNDLVIEFVAVTLGGEGRLQYQSRLRAEDDWSAPHDWRAISLARLAPGRYAFEVRAIGPSGQPSGEVAGFDFEVLPPFWQRWWFTALILMALAAPAYALHRARVRRILAIEGVRRQVALDLHDDIGSGLAQIAVLGEVARQRAAPVAGEELDEITGLARGLRESMSDIVWAVDPRKDRLTDVVQRLKQVAYNLFETEGIRVDVRCPPEPVMDQVVLPSDRRRHLLLLFKEAMSNAARHGAPSSIQVDVALRDRRLAVRMRDDGRGFDPASASGGHGLDSMRHRAEALGGTLRIASSPGAGVVIELDVSV